MIPALVYFTLLLPAYWNFHTAWNVSVFWVALVQIFPYLDWIRRDIPYLSVLSPNARKYDRGNSKYGHFYAVSLSDISVHSQEISISKTSVKGTRGKDISLEWTLKKGKEFKKINIIEIFRGEAAKSDDSNLIIRERSPETMQKKYLEIVYCLQTSLETERMVVK